MLEKRHHKAMLI